MFILKKLSWFPLTLKCASLSIIVMLTACTQVSVNDDVRDETTNEVRGEAKGAIKVVRLNNSQPIITQKTFEDVGASSDASNINGPSVIRIPDWVKIAARASPKAGYYLYFAHHQGAYIRMAWAANIEGPWTLFNVGSKNDSRDKGRGVLDMGSNRNIKKPVIEFSGGVGIWKHIASPDVIIDELNQQFILYFHGPSKSTTPGGKNFDTGNQKTFVATSKYGLNFNAPDGDVIGGVGGGDNGYGLKNATLGSAYMRAFTYANELYAITNTGVIWKAPNASIPWQTTSPRANSWEQGPLETNPIYANLAKFYDPKGPRGEVGNAISRIGAPRHFATYLREDRKTLEAWYTSRGDMPERIFMTTIDLSATTWKNWQADVTDAETVHSEMLRPKVDWEGVNWPIAASASGAVVDAHELRDPAIFKDIDGKRYLFYSGNGEDAIGIAEIIGGK